jgi:LacI family transcriptional regulator
VAADCGYEVTTCSEAESLFQKLWSFHATHIMLDLMMPGMDGIQALGSLAHAGSKAKILIFSGVNAKVIESAHRFGIEIGLNTPAAVRDIVWALVIEAAEALGYSPNPAVKAVRLQKVHIVGVAVPTLDYAIYARIVNSFQTTLSAAGYMVFVLTVDFDNAQIFDPVRLLVERAAEALLLIGRIDDQRLLDYLEERRIPVVTTFSFQRDAPFPSIGFETYAASRQLID